MAAIPLTVFLSNQSQDLRQYASEIGPHELYSEKTYNISGSDKIQPKILSSANNAGNLPDLGLWQGRRVKIIPSDRFSIDKNYFSQYGVLSMLSMKDGRLLGGGMGGFFVKQKSDLNWNNLSIFEIPQEFQLSSFTFPKILEDSQGDAYLLGHKGTIRFNVDNTLTKLINPIDNGAFVPTDSIPYKNGMVSYGNGPVGWGNGAIYFHSKTETKAWLAPRLDPRINSDNLFGIFQAPESSDYFYAFVSHPNIDPTRARQYLYKFEIQGDIINATKLGILTIDRGDWIIHNIHLVKVNGVNILYGERGNTTVNQSFALIKNFDPNNANLHILNIKVPSTYPDGPDPYGEFKDYVIENPYAGSLWAIGGDYLIGLYYTQGLGISDNYQISLMTYYDERINYLANPYTKSIALDIDGNIMVGNQYLPGQFKDGLITIFEKTQVSTPTPSITSTPTPTPKPTIRTSKTISPSRVPPPPFTK